MNRLRYIPFITWFSLLALANAQNSNESLAAERQPSRLSENLRSRVAEPTPEERSAFIENHQKMLTSGKYFVTQSWSQEKKYRRPYHINVPESRTLESPDKHKRFPVFIFLHGNGGNAMSAMQGFMRRHEKMVMHYILVFAQGYRESWNIVSERSKADDLGFIESIVQRLATFKNVAPDDFSIMGNSNGAALVNQIAIETSLPHIRNYITGVSQLNAWQYDGKHFKAKGDQNQYHTVATPMKGKRLMNISGTEDKLVPYHGGPSKFIPANDGKLKFVAAEESIYLWAREMGYMGEKKTHPSSKTGGLEIFSYLNGDVVHYKVNQEGHGATRTVTEDQLMRFLKTEKTVVPQ
ncbi:hypothetical protein N8667_00125 [Verrucomicrobia bacterium]|nr:hypothetical protein [Verrucomicrobiota bacterium]